LPKLIDLYEKYEDLKDKFEIVAFHDDRAKSFEELDKILNEKKIVEQRWKGKPLPFPILLDSAGTTVKEYGIRAFPTILLIDPEGKLVKFGHHEVPGFLEEKLKELKPAEK
jgi:thioredoxin-related protein